MLVSMRTVCPFRTTQGEHMLSPQGVNQHIVWYYAHVTLCIHVCISERFTCSNEKDSRGSEWFGSLLLLASESQWLYARLQANGMLVLCYTRGAHMLCPPKAEPAYFVILSECTYKYLRLSWCGKTSHLVYLKKLLGPWMAWKSQRLCPRLQAYGMLVPRLAGRAYAVSVYSWVSITWDIMCVWLRE